MASDDRRPVMNGAWSGGEVSGCAVQLECVFEWVNGDLEGVSVEVHAG